jgi:hypothetical protein
MGLAELEKAEVTISVRVPLKSSPVAHIVLPFSFVLPPIFVAHYSLSMALSIRRHLPHVHGLVSIALFLVARKISQGLKVEFRAFQYYLVEILEKRSVLGVHGLRSGLWVDGCGHGVGLIHLDELLLVLEVAARVAAPAVSALRTRRLLVRILTGPHVGALAECVAPVVPAASLVVEVGPSRAHRMRGRSWEGRRCMIFIHKII